MNNSPGVAASTSTTTAAPWSRTNGPLLAPRTTKASFRSQEFPVPKVSLEPDVLIRRNHHAERQHFNCFEEFADFKPRMPLHLENGANLMWDQIHRQRLT